MQKRTVTERNVKEYDLGVSKEKGFTIIELVLVLAIIGVLVTLATFSFHQWQVRSNVESQTRQMLADFNQLRFRAQTSKQKHSITINANSYRFRSYSSLGEPLTSGTTVLGGTHNVKYQLKKTSAAYYAGETFEIDQQGLMSIDIGTYPTLIIPIYLEYTGGAPSVDCINMRIVRTAIGKTNTSGGSCDEN